MIPPTSIDGTDITGATIDGTDVQEITVDGQTVFTAGPPRPPSGVAYYTFNNADTSGATAIDVWGSNNGTISGATTGVTGANDTYNTAEAYNFDGLNDFVDTGFIPNTNSFSFSCFFKPESGSGTQYLIGNPSVSGDLNHTAGFGVRFVDGNVNVLSGSGNFNGFNGSSLALNTYHHVVVTHGTNWNIYIDGTIDATSSIVYDVTDVEAYIGASDNYGDNFDGSIDDVRYYDKELTSTEVSDLYNTGSIL